MKVDLTKIDVGTGGRSAAGANALTAGDFHLVQCPSCHGYGWRVPHGRRAQCGLCFGSGSVTESIERAYDWSKAATCDEWAPPAGTLNDDDVSESGVSAYETRMETVRGRGRMAREAGAPPSSCPYEIGCGSSAFRRGWFEGYGLADPERGQRAAGSGQRAAGSGQRAAKATRGRRRRFRRLGEGAGGRRGRPTSEARSTERGTAGDS